MLNSLSSKLNSITEASLSFKQRSMRFSPETKVNTIKQSWELDPSYVTAKDINGKDGKIIYSAGMRVNPLTITTLPDKLLFIDGNDERQVKRALEFPVDGHIKRKIILVNGSPQILIKKFNTKFYLDPQRILCKKLGIKKFPSVVSQRGLKLVVEELTDSTPLVILGGRV
jgi:hypothetical protein